MSFFSVEKFFFEKIMIFCIFTEEESAYYKWIPCVELREQYEV